MRGDLRVVLYRPQIPQNCGNVARSCAATGVPLELVAPLGFRVDDAKLRRAGLDYWHAVCARVHEADGDGDGWPALLAAYDAAPAPKRLVAFTVYGATHYAGPAFSYRRGDWLLFGSETEGLAARAHDDVRARGGALVKIPMRGGARAPVRALNLATSVGVGVFEALRQLDLEAWGSGGGAGGGQVVEPRDDALWRETPMAQAAAAAAAAAERGGGGGG
jgi:tRNA (cytidine/uridine-2'-O-)-methyltransferase